MGKSALIKKIHNAAVNYQKYLAGRTFLYVYDDSVVEIVFKSSSFQHLTGVKTNLKAKGFYAHAKKKNGLRPGEVMFDKTHPYDLAEKKMDYLGDLYKVTCSDVMIATDIVTISAVYKVGVTNFRFILLCGPNRDTTGQLIDEIVWCRILFESKILVPAALKNYMKYNIFFQRGQMSNIILK